LIRATSARSATGRRSDMSKRYHDDIATGNWRDIGQPHLRPRRKALPEAEPEAELNRVLARL